MQIFSQATLELRLVFFNAVDDGLFFRAEMGEVISFQHIPRMVARGSEQDFVILQKRQFLVFSGLIGLGHDQGLYFVGELGWRKLGTVFLLLQMKGDALSFLRRNVPEWE